jgi:hypothetical protein
MKSKEKNAKMKEWRNGRIERNAEMVKKEKKHNKKGKSILMCIT